MMLSVSELGCGYTLCIYGEKVLLCKWSGTEHHHSSVRLHELEIIMLFDVLFVASKPS